jgi:hypothetical protein
MKEENILCVLLCYMLLLRNNYLEELYATLSKLKQHFAINTKASKLNKDLASTQMFLLQNNYIPTDNRQQEERKVN